MTLSPKITFILPNGPVTIHFPTPTSSTLINSIPPKSIWGPPLHWHETHIENFRVRRGFALVTFGRVTRICGPDDGIVTVPRFVLHRFERADTEGGRAFWSSDDRLDAGKWTEEDVEVEEWTEPEDGLKEVFFRNGMGYYREYMQPLIIDRGSGDMKDLKRLVRMEILRRLVKRGLHLMAFQRYHDNFLLMAPVAVGMDVNGKANWLARSIVYIVFGIAAAIGWLMGWRYWWEQYTPQALWAECEKEFGKSGKLKTI